MLRNVFGCVSEGSSKTLRHQKVKFGAPLSTALKNGYLPIPMIELLVYVAREGIDTRDIFRRPGNPTDTRRVVKRLSEGKPVIFSNYSFYTLASVVKKFLLSIPGGVFSPEGEETLLKMLTIGYKMEQYDAMHDYIQSCSTAHQQLLSLLFGIWFMMVHNSQQNFMTTEALSRSVAGSMFHTCAMDPAKVEKASRIMQLLIDNFSIARVFGQHNIEYFVVATHIDICARETLKFEYSEAALLPPLDKERYVDAALSQLHSISKSDKNGRDGHQFHNQSRSLVEDSNQNRQESDRETNLLTTLTISAPEVSLLPSPKVLKRPKSVEDSLNEAHNHTLPKLSLGRYNSIKRKQLERLRQRSDWFLGPSTVSSQAVNICSMFVDTEGSSYHQPSVHELVQKKSSGSSMKRAQLEGIVQEVCSDADSVFSADTSHSESPVSELVLTNNAALCIHRHMLNSDPLDDVVPNLEDVVPDLEDVIPDVEDVIPDLEDAILDLEDDSNDNNKKVANNAMTISDKCFFMLEHKYRDFNS